MHSVEVSSSPNSPPLFVIVFWGETNSSSLLQMFFKIGVLKNFANFRGKHHCWSIFRSSCSQVFFKVGVLKNFTTFTEKHPCGTLFLTKLQAWRPITLTKRCFPVFIAKFLRTALFIEHHLWWLLLYFFNKVAGLKTSNVIKKRLQHRYFPAKFAKFLRALFSQNISGGCFWTNPGDFCGSLCGEVTLWWFSTSLSLLFNVMLNS